MEESIIYAKKYLEDLLSFFGLNIDVHATRDDEVMTLSVPSTHMNGFLIGQHGDTMRALQFMVSTALRNNGYEYSRVNVDIADYKKGRQNRLAEIALPWVEKVKATGKEMTLDPMNPADRRVIHKLADEHGLVTESIGYGRDRRVVIKPTSDEPAEPKEDEKPAEEPAEPEAKEKKPKKKSKKDTEETKETESSEEE